jgi:hypothetical protein
MARTNIRGTQIADATVDLTVDVTATLPVANGGTGAVTLSGVLIGNGASAVTAVAAPAGTIVGTTDTQTQTNKRFVQRVNTTTSASTVTINTDTTDLYTVTALAAAVTFANPTGTPNTGDMLRIRVKDNGTARVISWGTSFVASGITALPTTTVISKTMWITFFWDEAASKWVCMAADVTGY